MTSIVVGKDRISLLESERYVAGTKQVYKIKVAFSDDWQDLEKKIIFKNDSFELGVDVRSQSETFPIPCEMLAEPSNKLQIGAYGYSCDQVVLNTRWASLGRVINGTVDSNGCGCGCNPPIPTKPSPVTYEYLKELIDRKADRLTYEDGMFILWSGNDPLSSFEAPLSLPAGGEAEQVLAKASDVDGDVYWKTVNSTAVRESAPLKVPLGTVQVWAGSIDEIPESYSLCDGQNGTPDLRSAMIIGASDDLPPGTIVDAPSGSTPARYSARDASQPIRYYALGFIQKTSFTAADLKEGKTAYELAVDNGYMGTEQEWLESLNGDSAYDLAVKNGFTGTEQEWLASLKGEPGQDGIDGKSAYQIALDAGYVGTEQEFADALAKTSNQIVSDEIVETTQVLSTGPYTFHSFTIKNQNGEDLVFSNDIVYVDKTDPAKMVLTSLSNTKYICALDSAGNVVSVSVKTLNDQIKEIAGSSGGGSGAPGPQGPPGPAGEDGASAYEIAVANGFSGSEEEWLASLKGSTGLSAYQVAKANGFNGTEAEWVESLRGAPGQDGTDGKSAYQLAVDAGFEGTEAEWLNSLKGTPGLPGDNGDSAYQIALNNGFVGTEQEWLASLKGDKGDKGDSGVDGKSAYQIAVDNGYAGTEQEWLSTFTKGEDGKSAYQVAVDNGFTGSEAEWLASLKGDKGDTGSSAYDIAVTNGFEGTEDDWLKSLHGKAVQTIQDYSTGEVLIGRWIDDRPVYRRIIRTVVEQQESVVTIAAIPNIELIGAITGIIQVQNGSRWCSIPGTDQGTDYGINYVPETGAIELYTSYITEVSKVLQLTVEYVKIGDSTLTDDQLVINPGSSTTDHRLLTNRDAADQHPITAISTLSEQLDAVPKQAIQGSQIDSLFST